MKQELCGSKGQWRMHSEDDMSIEVDCRWVEGLGFRAKSCSPRDNEVDIIVPVFGPAPSQKVFSLSSWHRL